MIRTSAKLLAATIACLPLATLDARGDVRLPKVFGDNMVLQRDAALPVWGWDEPGRRVTVSIGEAKVTATADAAGAWRLSMPAMPADGKTYSVTVKGSSAVTFSNVVVGEVWICSGQSNMQMGLGNCDDAQREIAAADVPGIRLMQVPMTTAGLPQDDVAAKWELCTPTTVAVGSFGGFSAAGYYFGRKLHETLKVPVGLIDSSWGGTLIEPWTPPVGFASSPRFRYLSATIDGNAKRMAQANGGGNASLASVGKLGSGDPTAIYNAMIHPLVPFAIRGAIWYQGEANLEQLCDGANYTLKQEALIKGWRSVWNQGDFPFYFVQLAPFDNDSAGYRQLPLFWEAQSRAQSVPNTGMAITSDITSDLKDIHPKNKKDVGLRLAGLALHDTFGMQDVVCRGPRFQSMRVDGAKVVVTFEHSDGGLNTRDDAAPDCFTIAGADGTFVQATAKITGAAEVSVWNDAVPAPVAVRFAWHRAATPNLRNGAGLPANSFRTDRTARTSLAFGKPVRASCDAQADHVPEDVVDGITDNSSGWHAGTPNQWVEVDLQKPHSIDRVAVFPYYDGQRYYQYVVETSEDQTTWAPVARKGDDVPSSDKGDDYRFPATSARYVRVTMIKNSANPGVHLNELLVFEANAQ